MPPDKAAEAYRECRRGLLDQFSTYDQAVDVVSCWQTFLSSALPNELTYFDRYPQLGTNGQTPDFAALFLERYGLIGETKRTFPQDERAFRREMDQLKKYDQDLALVRNGEGDTLTPELHDIVLVINAQDSAEIAARVNALLLGDEYQFENNLVLMEYFYDAGSRVTKYSFRKFPGENRPFRDLVIPHDGRLEVNLGEKKKPFRVSVSQFMPVKLQEVLCNDDPPPIYLALYLWNKVFYNLLTGEQREEWRLGNPQKILPVRTDVAGLTTALNRDYLPTAGVRAHWVRTSLEFLVASRLATKEEDTYEIGFSNRSREIGSRRFGEAGEEQQHVIKEYAGLLADRYCGTQTAETRAGGGSGVKKGRQTTLDRQK